MLASSITSGCAAASLGRIRRMRERWPASFSRSGRQVVHLVPLELLQVQHQAALAPRQGITDSLPQTLGVRS